MLSIFTIGRQLLWLPCFGTSMRIKYKLNQTRAFNIMPYHEGSPAIRSFLQVMLWKMMKNRLQYIITQKICHWYLLQGLQNTRLLLTCHNFKYQVYVHFLFYFKEFTVWLMECNKNLEACFILSSCIVTVLTGTT